MPRPLKADVIPAEAIRAAYLDLDTPLWVAGARLGCGDNSIIKRARAMGLPSRGVLLTERAQARAEKPCSKCREAKAREDFRVDWRNRSGRRSACKDCERECCRASTRRWAAKRRAES